METAQKLLSVVKKIPKEYIFPGIIALAGLILFGYGLMSYFQSVKARENDIQPQNFTKQVSPKPLPSVKIDVEGAVVTPGVYSVTFDSRVQDGLIAAGGLSSSADRGWVEKHINLSAKLSDGMKLYIPRIGEITNSQITNGGSSTDSDVLATSTININDATSQSLDSLPGIGAVTAQKIITNRPYADIQELVTKKVISQKVFDQIKDKISAL